MIKIGKITADISEDLKNHGKIMAFSSFTYWFKDAKQQTWL